MATGIYEKTEDRGSDNATGAALVADPATHEAIANDAKIAQAATAPPAADAQPAGQTADPINPPDTAAAALNDAILDIHAQIEGAAHGAGLAYTAHGVINLAENHRPWARSAATIC